ncbi:MAG: hypothetical protein K6G61_01450 [Solobacterium sp.]|nr:hypothetical protein [Solobacterium sp.]
MSSIVFGKNQFNVPMTLDLPTVMLVTGDKDSGKTFLFRTLIEAKKDGRIVVLTNKPEYYHGLGEKFLEISKDAPEIRFLDRITIVDGRKLYEDDPEHILDDEIKIFDGTLQENDMVIVDEAYPFLQDEINKFELQKTLEDSWMKGVTFVIATNREQLMIDEAPILFEMSAYALILKQDKDTAVKAAEMFGGDRGKYEMLQAFNLFEFGKGLFLRRTGEIDFIQIGNE